MSARRSEMVPIAQPVADTLLTMLGNGMATMSADQFVAAARLVAHIQYARDMSVAQAAMVPVVRAVPNSVTGRNYADLLAVDAAIRPIYASHGFSLSFTEVPTEGSTVRIACIVLHRSGHSETHHLEAQADTVGPQGKPNKTHIQGVGSAVSYLRRYLTLMVFNIATKDDNDGHRVTTDGEIISREQARELADLIARCSADPRATIANERGVLARFNLAALRSIEDVSPRDFPRLRNALRSKWQRIQSSSRQTGEAA